MSKRRPTQCRIACLAVHGMLEGPLVCGVHPPHTRQNPLGPPLLGCGGGPACKRRRTSHTQLQSLACRPRVAYGAARAPTFWELQNVLGCEERWGATDTPQHHTRAGIKDQGKKMNQEK